MLCESALCKTHPRDASDSHAQHEYIDALEKLRRLERLEWDNSALCYFIREIEETSGGACTISRLSLLNLMLAGILIQNVACEASLAALMKLPTLKTVRMISFSSRTVTTCTMRRNERGEYEGYSSSKSEIFPDFEASQRLISSLYK